jgi:hypothetical protein
MEDTDFVTPGEVPQITLQRQSAELAKIKKEMASVQKSIDELVNGMNGALDQMRIKYNVEKALALDADITYRETEEGKTIISITKNGNTTESTYDSFPVEVKAGIDRAVAIRRKKISKNEAKSNIKTKYKIGDHLILRGKIKDGSERLVKKFEIKKIIWSIKSKPMNIFILKQLEGPNNNTTLDRNDCKKYHIKYEEGLQAYSMMLNFTRIRKNK